VAAGPGVALEDVDLVRAGENVRRPESRDAAADDRDPHVNWPSLLGEYRFGDSPLGFLQ
jgi:hypothetical protein